jgi:hypothetical protein
MRPACSFPIRFLFGFVLICLAGTAFSAEKNPAGMSPQYLLPNGWAISPVGKQIKLDGLPLNLVPVPVGPYVLATSNGYPPVARVVICKGINEAARALPFGNSGQGSGLGG